MVELFSRYLMFEIKRLLKMPKNIVTIILFGVGIVVFYMLNLHLYEVTRPERMERLELEKEVYHLEIQYFRRFQGTQAGDALHELLNNSYRQLAQQHLVVRLADRGVEDESLRERELRAIIRRNEIWLISTFERQDLVREDEADDILELTLPLRYRNLDPDNLIAGIQQLRYIENRELTFIHSPYYMIGWHFLYRLLTVFGRFAIPILVVLLTADVFSTERDAGSYKFLLLQPLSRTTVYLGKLLASLLLCIGVIVTGFMLFFGVNGILNGLCEGGYPVRFAFFQTPLAYLPYDGDADIFLAGLNPGMQMPAGFVTMRAYLLWGLFFTLIYILFLLTFTSIVSIFADNSISALAICLGIVFASLIVGEYLPQGTFVWNPIEYINLQALGSGDMRGYMWYPLGFALIIGSVGVVCFRKKNIIC